MVRAYKLYTTGVSTASNCTSLQIPRNGTVLGVSWSARGTAGAGVTGQLQYELSTSSVSTLGVNDTPGNSLSTIAMRGEITSGAASVCHAHAIGVPITAGDKLYVHAIAAGTAFSNGYIECTVFVNH